jgi:hypothetical protein
MGPDNPQLSPRIATTTRSVTPTLHCKFAGAFAGLAEGEKAKHAGTRWPRFADRGSPRGRPAPSTVTLGKSDEPASRRSIGVLET